MAEEEMTTMSGQPHPAAAIADMIDLAYSQDFNKATEIFNDQIGDRVTAVLDQEKIALADEMFNDQEEHDDQEEYDDEELEAGDEADEAEDGEEVEYDEDSEEYEESEEA